MQLAMLVTPSLCLCLPESSDSYGSGVCCMSCVQGRVCDNQELSLVLSKLCLGPAFLGCGSLAAAPLVP